MTLEIDTLWVRFEHGYMDDDELRFNFGMQVCIYRVPKLPHGAFVTFPVTADAIRAFANSPEHVELLFPQQRLWVGNIHEDTAYRELNWLFDCYGSLVGIEYDQSRQCAIVTFRNHECAASAREDWQGFPLRESELVVQFPSRRQEVYIERNVLRVTKPRFDDPDLVWNFFQDNDHITAIYRTKRSWDVTFSSVSAMVSVQSALILSGINIGLI